MPNMVKESDPSAALLARDEILRDPSIQECRSESTVVNITKKPVDSDVGTMRFQYKTRLKLNLSSKYKVNHLYCTDLCCCGAEEDSCK